MLHFNDSSIEGKAINKDEQHFRSACKFAIQLGKIAHKSGTQSRRLEWYLREVIKAFGYDGVFIVNPSEIRFNFIKDDPIHQVAYTIYMDRAGYNLAVIDQLGDLVAAVIAGDINLDEGMQQLERLDGTGSLIYGKALTAIGYALAGFGFAGFLRCSILDMLLSAALGVLVYLMIFASNTLCPRYGYGYGQPFVCAFVVGLLASLINIAVPGINVYLIALSALIYLIPGFRISCGIIEISYQYVLSGLINLINGMVYLVVLFFGVFVGVSIVQHFFSLHSMTDPVLSSYLSWPLAMVMAVGLGIIFQIPKRHFAWSLVCIFLVCLGILFGRWVGGLNIGNLFGSIVAVMFSNWWSTRYRHPASLILIPSVVFLVSGSIGFRGFVAISAHNVNLGTYDLIQMVSVAVTIAIGLAIGNILYRSKVTL